ncbi:hypothetical protein Bbelb_191220 [Branchiostoma belcheri]|nr:hypothetical protein Bbelb_191220 [Branchiostoma belcheri]
MTVGEAAALTTLLEEVKAAVDAAKMDVMRASMSLNAGAQAGLLQTPVPTTPPPTTEPPVPTGSPDVNIARGKTAHQTSTRSGGGSASRAVDGNTNGQFNGGSCTHTWGSGSYNPTWWVDLGQTYQVNRVVIYNRWDCCRDRLNPFHIHIGDSAQVTANPRCGGDHRISTREKFVSIRCPGMTGRYVGIRLQGYRILTLCEIQVFSNAEETCQVGNGASYRGTLAVTETGRTCQRWDRQSPHSHNRTPRNYPAGDLAGNNYCRNPDGWHALWCYTTDPASRWELCDLPVCG